MAVGDIISQTYATGVSQTFVPALGVEIIVTSGFASGTGVSYYGITDGTQTAYTRFIENSNIGGRNPTNIKIGITNTYYLIMQSDLIGSGFTGIQIK